MLKFIRSIAGDCTAKQHCADVCRRSAGAFKVVPTSAHVLVCSRSLPLQNPEDPQLQEFLEVTQPRAKTATWSNEDTLLMNANKMEEDKVWLWSEYCCADS